MCKKDSLLWQTRFVDQKYVCPVTPREILWPLVQALQSWEPHFVVPGDRWSLRYLQGMASSALVKLIFPRITEVLQRSLGNPYGYGVLDSKRKLLDMARGIGDIHTPNDREVESEEHALSLIEEQYEFPVVVKQEHCSGGEGVWICGEQKDVQSSFEEISQEESEKSLLHAAWKAYNLTPFMRGVDSSGSVSVQQFIDGEPFLHSFVALEGEMLAGNTAQRELPYDGPNSPHCRYRARENNEIQEAAIKIVGKTGFSGFGCLDFMMEHETNTPYLIECNPFPVNIAHLGHVLGEDLCRALRHGLINSASSPMDYKAEKENSKEVAMLFPYEVIRDPDSTNILSHPEDIPLDDSSLLRAMQDRFDIPDRSIGRLVESH